MDLEYDRKFEEMKKYIPFLENMIHRLENTTTTSNPRQAQLDKIRSLRDLLMDKKKRMKMENLLKCEQVLVNLYAKVEQRDTLPAPKIDVVGNKQNDIADLNTVRKKLKSAVTKLKTESEDTLPEIARASATEEVCVPGSKEPALFQRRPNMPSTTSSHFSPTKNKEALSRRNYTRVLLSPETSQKRWNNNETPSDKPLFCRRSPKQSPRRLSPVYYRKERRKSRNKLKNLKSKNLNITLNVPEESINSLNTKDILSRIINCSDNDIDIDTLRELRTQILGELKDTGTKDDISDIILKSYKKSNKKDSKVKEVEEGELSDSESEAIESIYGSLVIMDKDKSSSDVILKCSDKDKPRKIQICLVINSDKSSTQEENHKSIPVDISEFETFEKKEIDAIEIKPTTDSIVVTEQDSNNFNVNTVSSVVEVSTEKEEKDTMNVKKISLESQLQVCSELGTEIHLQEKKDNVQVPEDINKSLFVRVPNCNLKEHDKEANIQSPKDKTKNKLLDAKTNSEMSTKVTNENVKSEIKHTLDTQIKKINLNSSALNTLSEKKASEKNCEINTTIQKLNSEFPSSCEEHNPNTNIPLLEPTKNVSEIDILQALKKEILSETTSVLNTEPITPPLHQPKVTKVINAHEIGAKKRISIESYKAKTNTSTKSTSIDNNINTTRDDVARKQSLKLTEKECERFNLSKLNFNESSDDDDKSNLSLDDIYGNLAPKSPDHEDFADTGLKPPVIIPSDPVKTTIVSSEADVDMRKLLPSLQTKCSIPTSAASPSICKDNLQKSINTEKEVINNDKPLLDPRMKRETSCVPESPNPYMINAESKARSAINYASSTLNLNNFPNVNVNSPSISNANATPTRASMISPNLTTNIPPLIPNLTSNMTPNRTSNLAPSVTIARTFEMTPLRQTFDNDDLSSRKHVYTPIFQETRDYHESQRQRWEKSDKTQTFWEDRDIRSNSIQRDIDYRDPRSSTQRDRFICDNRDLAIRIDCPTTPSHYFGRLDIPPTPNASFGRMDCPNTPNHPFGRMDCPNTPTPSFGRMDCPNTPTPSFGRMDCPNTPTPSFGWTDCPMTPITSFGRSDCPSTPNHPFGRPEPLLSTPFIRHDFNQSVSNQNYSKPQDPRLNRGSDYDNYYARDDDRERRYYKERKFNTDSYKSEQNNRHNSDQFRRYQREHSVSRNDRNKNFEQGVRNYKDNNRDTSVGRSFNRDFEPEKSKNRSSSGRNYESRKQNEYKKYDDYERHNFQHEKSVGRREECSHDTYNRSGMRNSNECSKFYKENNLSVKRHGGHSFTIDTSINRTFQSSDKNLSSTFDSRRQRAVSVGRTLIRDSAMDRHNETESTPSNKNIHDQNSKFRRACSVGREVKNNNLDFKEIKEDLRSFKFKGNINLSVKTQQAIKVDTQKVPDIKKINESRSRKEICHSFKSTQNNAKYSPKKNNRDPRMRREYSHERDEKYRDNYRSNSYNRKNHGIVYSNDNISKGNILGPGYGVKNYKIPKIKRPQDEKDANECMDSKTKDIAEVNEGNESLVSFEDKNTNKKNMSNKKVNLKNDQTKKSSNVSCQNSENIKRTESETVSKEIVVIKVPEKNKSKFTKDVEIIKANEEGNSLINQQENVEQKLNTSGDVLLENSDKRLTRSVTKHISNNTFEELDTSPLKRTKRVKKPLVYDSESDDNDTNQNNKVTCVGKRNIEDLYSKIPEDDPKSSLESIKSKSETKTQYDKNIIPFNNKEKQTLDNTLDDLEIFSDNIVADPVIDNINALIADLDHDLDSSKNQDNSNFTKELSLETMLENITSPEECDNIEDFSDISEPPKPEKKNLNGSNDEVVAGIENNISEISCTYLPMPLEDKGLKLEISKNKEDSKNFAVDHKKALEHNLEHLIEPTSENPNDFVTNHNNVQESLEQKQDSLKQQKNGVKETNNLVNNLDIEDTLDTEAVVSTSGDDNRRKEKIKLEDLVSETMFHNQSNATPDSTINSNEINENINSHKSMPDSTNEKQCEMSSDITSTHNAIETISADLSESSSSHTSSAQIETIGKLLSILQDKSKIKELISLLGNQSSENDKIKKKLEKLSAIASDDENNVSENKNKSRTDLENNVNDTPISDKQDINSDKNSLQTLQKDFRDSEDSNSNLELLKRNEDRKPIVENSIPNQDENKVSERAFDELPVSKNKIIDTLNLEKELNHSKKADNNADQEREKNMSERSCEESSMPVNDNVLNQSVSNDDQDNKISCMNDVQTLDSQNVLKDEVRSPKKTNKTGISRRGRKKATAKSITLKEKRLTRSDVANLRCEKSVRKKPTELQKLQDDIREMFLRDDILNATGIRMCRLAKLVDDKRNQNEEHSPAESICSSQSTNQGPLVVLEKFNEVNISQEITLTETLSKKRGVKGKRIIENSSSRNIDDKIKNKGVSVRTDANLKPGLKVKTKLKEKVDDIDPYAFETDSVNQAQSASNLENDTKSSESENESVGSSKSFGSIELLTEVKKKVKRKRGTRGWKAGIIKPKNKKKKIIQKKKIFDSLTHESVETQNVIETSVNYFTDKNYCFLKNQSCYDCRQCSYSGTEIVHHYKKQHPHSEIPLSRMSPAIAKEAIKESEKLNFQTVSKVSSKKYVCRFCFEEFGTKKPVLEAFFWHIVSMHTGEYKQLCSECLNVTRCPFNLDIPPPPKEAKGQLLGYICEKCNYTQVSLENLKTHVILRHNDEQTAVYTINLAVMTKATLNNLLEKSLKRDANSHEGESARLLRSSRSNVSFAESSDVKSDVTEESYQNLRNKFKENFNESCKNETEIKPRNIQSKITFENDTTDEISNFDDNETCNIKIKEELKENQSTSNVELELNENLSTSHIEQELNENQNTSYVSNDQTLGLEKQTDDFDRLLSKDNIQEDTTSNDIFDYPHFKIKYTETGSKEYVCCINGNDLHYKTTLLISLKKHVQLKHTEVWDGYCFVCKVIVTSQGVHHFKDCLQHMLDKHNNFPILEEVSSKQNVPNVASGIPDDTSSGNLTAKSYINVRPLAELILNTSSSSPQTVETSTAFPIIESVVSLGAETEQSRPSPTYPSTEHIRIDKQYKYEEVQAEIMSKKHSVVLDTMMTNIKLVHVFKCGGRFCSFTTDSAEDALLHASTHMRVGGENSLNCVYCDYDATSNAIDLITHVFKVHGRCQYVCSQCFYRAATTQLVDAHIKRVHENAINKQILYTPFQTGPISDDNVMPREAAVQYYVCMVGRDTDAACKYRTYTPGRFSEHLNTKHSSETKFPCCICPTVLSTSSDVVAHIKSHGLKLYQCVWCVYGSDNEAGSLAHSSSNHPDKFPKAYLRIITNKEGTKEFRVLPLAHLNKTEISFVEVVPTNFKENPVKIAEQSTELEKLISQTAFMIESTSNVEEIESSSVQETNHQAPLLEELSPEETTDLQTSRATPPPLIEEVNIPENRITPTLEREEVQPVPNKTTQIVHDIVCLDSDEEDSSQNVIDLSDDTTVSGQGPATLNMPAVAEKPVILPVTELFICHKCKMTCKFGTTFKKHIVACYSHITGPIPCAHCPLSINKRDIVLHYIKMHSERADTKVYTCSKCPQTLSSLAQVREHEKTAHSAKPISNSNEDANVTKVAGLQKAGPKRRKRSLGSKDKATEPPEKIKKFGPHDIHLLPINPILDESVFCSLCEFSTKVRHNMVRHLQLHAEQQPVPQTAPVNPVPHLETNEKHFDKMLNLASSSIITKADKTKADSTTASSMIPPEAASRYPKHVPEKHRLTCGAKGCSYISVDESMLKRHWEALHTGTSAFHCVHCPPYQHLDTSKPLTASRVIAHLKMHDTSLYACSLCSYYHYRLLIVEHHLAKAHSGGQVLIVREESSIVPASPTQSPAAAPTMDLKPWQCGLCKYKTMLRQEVVDHCAKLHNSKMQYKCAYCAFRTSNSENITKHQFKSHSGKPGEIFYYYYQEGSISDEPDGMPRWQKQSQKFTAPEVNIKSEIASSGDLLLPIISQTMSLPKTPANTHTSDVVDLNLVKKEVIEISPDTVETLCKEFGEFCEPNGLKYKCSLCKHVIEDTEEAMQSHLYEELKYRKWGCSICSYKAFHKAGLNEHMQTEHRQNREPVALPVDTRVETWVAKLLEHQTALILKNKENLAKQKEEIFRPVPGTSTKSQATTPTSSSSSKKLSMTELEKTFGSFGAPVNMSFCCPKCKLLFKEEDGMQNHLESELNKIRWFCSDCFVTFQTYHEAQFHCRSAHSGMFPRPVEVIRDATVRSSWVEAVIRVQKLSMNYVPLQNNIVTETERLENDEPENSLLVVRYEEQVPNPEQMGVRTKAATPDSDDERLVIDEPKQSKKHIDPGCQFCNYSTYNPRVLHDHILRHYNLKPFICGYCNLNATKRVINSHHKTVHPKLPALHFNIQIPSESPEEYLSKQTLLRNKFICFECLHTFTESESKTHKHDNAVATFGKMDDTVAKCCICFTLHKDVKAYHEHHDRSHEFMERNCMLVKLNSFENDIKGYACTNCAQKFATVGDLKMHIYTNHKNRLSSSILPEFKDPMQSEIIALDDEAGTKRKSDAEVTAQPAKRIAKKSTTKLPFSKTCARKSTTKLPFGVPNEPEEFSYYGMKPSTAGLEQVTALMPFCNVVMPFTLEKLNGIININPTVQVKKK